MIKSKLKVLQQRGGRSVPFFVVLLQAAHLMTTYHMVARELNYIKVGVAGVGPGNGRGVGCHGHVEKVSFWLVDHVLPEYIFDSCGKKKLLIHRGYGDDQFFKLKTLT